MRNIHRRLALIAMVPVVAFAVGLSAVAAQPPDKVTVCHQTGAGFYVQVTISERALPAHLRHGDVLMGDYGYCPS